MKSDTITSMPVLERQQGNQEQAECLAVTVCAHLSNAQNAPHATESCQ